MLMSAALVLLMTPGLALFYGGMVRRKNVLATLMYSHFALALVTIQWVVFGYSLAFGKTHGGLIGGADYLLLDGVVGTVKGSVPALVFMAFQMKFAIITPALISGAFVERIKFSAYVAFTLLWSTLVYDPVAHWVWAEGGWMATLGVLDFAGGTVVHWTAGLSALIFALFVGKRVGYGREKFIPHDLPMTITGAGLLWFGWFGFNAGSALSAGQTAALAFSTTHIAAASGAMAWVVAEWVFRRKPTLLGFVSGLVAGLVAITPGAGFVSPAASLVIGALAGFALLGRGAAQGAEVPLRRLSRRLGRAWGGGHAGRAPGRRLFSQGAQPRGCRRPPRRRSVTPLEAGSGPARRRRVHPGDDPGDPLRARPDSRPPGSRGRGARGPRRHPARRGGLHFLS
jgi:Amt family ammonium transporter